MGGKAFADALHVPRIPSNIYTRVRDRILAQLQNDYFEMAESPIEGPEKVDFGDIDILVCGPRDQQGSKDVKQSDLFAEIAKALDAKMWKQMKGSPLAHFAIPWPTTAEESAEGLEVATVEAERYIQVDIEICHDPMNYKWALLHQAHGDFSNIIGSMLRKYGLTITNSGFYVRIEELSSWNKAKSRVFLTQDPSLVLKFLGLEEEPVLTSFPSKDALCKYATTCKFFRPMQDQASTTEEEDTNTIKNTELTSNNRRRIKQRPLFTYWISEYLPNLPTHPPDAPGASESQASSAENTPISRGVYSDLTREEVIALVKAFFGPALALTFDRHRRTNIWLMQSERFTAKIRRELVVTAKKAAAEAIAAAQEGPADPPGDVSPSPAPEWGYVLKGVKRLVLAAVPPPGDPGLDDAQLAERRRRMDDGGGEEVPGQLCGPEPLSAEGVARVRRAYFGAEFEEVERWVLENWRVVGVWQGKIDRGRGAEMLRERLEGGCVG